MQQSIDETTTLIRAAQAGDRAAFARLVEDCYDQMYRFAFRYSGRREDAEDITQQACIKLARSISQFRFESAFSTWLYRLVINCARDAARARHDVVSGPAEAVSETDMGPAATGETQIMLAQVLARIETMGAGYRDAVVLVLGEGFSHREAAEVLEVRESTVSWRIHEVRKRLAEIDEDRQ